MRADYKALAVDSQWQQSLDTAEISMAALRGAVYSSALFYRQLATKVVA
ncbi:MULTISPECIES: hypothetical protein [Aeromonas]|jgi:hypothetical protein|nr:MULTISPECIES: hypothetical protein [Aeromonas]